MAKNEILCVGFELPGEEFQYVSYHSGASLLDADIILFEVGLDYCTDSINGTFQGKPSLSAESSIENRTCLNHWRTALKQAFDSGKTIFIFLKKPIDVYARTGSQDLSGTGRSQKVINHVDLIYSYSALPISFDSITPAKGKKVKIARDGGGILSAYWKELKAISSYEIYYDHKKSTPLLQTKSGDKTVASMISGKNGKMFLLPPLDFSSDDFIYYDEKKFKSFWTTEAVKYGRIVLKNIVEIHKALSRGFGRGPAPEWVAADDFVLKAEREISGKIEAAEKKISKLREQRLMAS